MSSKIPAMTTMRVGRVNNQIKTVTNRLVIRPFNKTSEELLKRFPDSDNLLRLDAMQNPLTPNCINRFAINGKRILLRDKDLGLFAQILDIVKTIKTEFQKPSSQSTLYHQNILKKHTKKFDEKTLKQLAMGEQERFSLRRSSNSTEITATNAALFEKQINDAMDIYFSPNPIKPIKGLKNISVNHFEDPFGFGEKYLKIDFTLTGDELKTLKQHLQEMNIQENMVLHNNRVYINIEKSGSKNRPSIFIGFIPIEGKIAPYEKLYADVLRILTKISDKGTTFANETIDPKNLESIPVNSIQKSKYTSLLYKNSFKQKPEYIKKIAKEIQDTMINF